MCRLPTSYQSKLTFKVLEAHPKLVIFIFLYLALPILFELNHSLAYAAVYTVLELSVHYLAQSTPLLFSVSILFTSSNQRLWESVRCRINVYPDTLNDFHSWLSTSKNQPFFINNRGFTERYFSDKVHASLMIEDYFQISCEILTKYWHWLVKFKRKNWLFPPEYSSTDSKYSK